MTDIPEAPVELLAPRHDVPRDGRSGFTVLGGAQVHYLEWGGAGMGAVLCLHGGGQTAYMYEGLGAALAPRYHVLAPDLPGHGDSDPVVESSDHAAVSARPDLSGPSRQAMAATLPGLCRAFGIGPVALVGASLGGLVGLALASSHPELVSALVLIDVGHRLEEEGVRRIIEFMRAHESFGSLEEAAEAVARYLPHRRNVRPENLGRNLRQRDDRRWVWKHTLGQRLAAAAGGPEDQGNWREILAGVDAEAAALRCPALVLRGVHSDVLSGEGAEEIAALIPDARLATVAGAGHLAAGDNPESTVSLVGAFLDEVVGGRPRA